MFGRIRPNLRLYTTFVRMAFLNILAYRIRYYTGILTYILFVSVHYYIWQAVYANTDIGSTGINGYSLPEMITYLTVGWIARSCYFSTIDEDLDEMVRTGQVSLVLLRPVNLHLMMLSQAFGESLFRILFFTLPITLALAFLYPITLPVSATAGAIFLLMSLGSFLILAEINFLLGLCSFKLQSIQGLSRAKYALIQLFSGLLLPLSFFPVWLRTPAEWLPFQLITSLPLQFYLGKIGVDQSIYTICKLLIWIAILSTLSEILWRRSIKQLSIQGG